MISSDKTNPIQTWSQSVSTLKQIEANRRNALKSTGPTTTDGKERSRCNALRHGLTAETVIVPLEDAEDYEAFEASVTASYEGETAVERELVLRLASVPWRLRRATGIETALFVSAAPVSNVESRPSHLALIGRSDHSAHTQSTASVPSRPDIKPGKQGRSHINDEVGRRFLNLAALPTFPLDRLSRYEHTLWRQAKQIIFTLELLQHCVRGRRHPRLLSSFQTGKRAF